MMMSMVLIIMDFNPCESRDYVWLFLETFVLKSRFN